MEWSGSFDGRNQTDLMRTEELFNLFSSFFSPFLTSSFLLTLLLLTLYLTLQPSHSFTFSHLFLLSFSGSPSVQEQWWKPGEGAGGVQSSRRRKQGGFFIAGEEEVRRRGMK